MKEDFQEAENDQHDLEKSYNEFKKLYGEDFSKTIDLNTWQFGQNLAELYPRIERELFEAKQEEVKTHQQYRDEVFPRIEERKNVPHAGLHSDVTLELIEKVHRGFLFNGAVTACGGLSTVYDSVPISITQLGVCLVNYQGKHGSYSHQLFRRDLRHATGGQIDEAIELIQRRHQETGSKISSLALRSIRSYAERAILKEKSNAKWFMGSGSPAPFELITGFWASYPEMKGKFIELMKNIIVRHQRFVYVQDSSHMPNLWTWGNALKPFEYLVIDTMEAKITQVIDTGNSYSEIRHEYQKFAREVGSKIAFGVYRVSKLSPPQIFYCHVDHIQTAVLIAMSDSALQMHSGTPMLLSLADNLCRNAFGKNDFIASIDQAHTRAEILTKINA